MIKINTGIRIGKRVTGINTKAVAAMRNPLVIRTVSTRTPRHPKTKSISLKTRTRRGIATRVIKMEVNTVIRTSILALRINTGKETVAQTKSNFRVQSPKNAFNNEILRGS